MSTTRVWHPTRTAERPVYHDDTRCPEGAAIEEADRRPGDGGRDHCEHCLGLLVEALKRRRSPAEDT